MNPRLVVLLFCASLLAVCARAKTILPDACGDDSVQFDVTIKKKQPPPAPPAAGKAQIIFIQSGWGVARYGIDGSWVGANMGDSYFAVTIDPGEHHLCMSYQDVFTSKAKQESARMLTFTPEAGKVYYFEATSGRVGGIMGSSSTTWVQNSGGAPGGQFAHSTSPGSPGMSVYGFVQLDEDTGKFRVKAWKPSTWTTN